MSIELCRHAELSQKTIANLRNAMSAFYRHPPASYYPMADKAAGEYNPQDYPFHCDLVSRIFPTATVLEVGCGTAHLCKYVEQQGGIYTGVDHGDELLERNRRHFPNALFLNVTNPLKDVYDIVASLYTLEHVADPPAYLEQIWNRCRPGGLVAIICPEFVDSAAFPNSVFFGKTPRRMREKLRALNITDFVRHLIDLKLRATWWKKRLRTSPPGAFWMNLRPSVLHGAEYTIDADAIHLTRCKDIVWFFEQRGASLVQTSLRMTSIAPEILRYNCYVVAQKPAGS